MNGLIFSIRSSDANSASGIVYHSGHILRPSFQTICTRESDLINVNHTKKQNPAFSAAPASSELLHLLEMTLSILFLATRHQT